MSEYWVLPEDALETHLTDGIVSLDTGDDNSPNGRSVKAEAMKKSGSILDFGQTTSTYFDDIDLDLTN